MNERETGARDRHRMKTTRLNQESFGGPLLG
jgi:hypothetical protein